MDLPDFIFDKIVDIIIGLSLGIFIMILHLRAHRDVDEVIKKIEERTAKEQEIDSLVERMVEEQTKLINEIHQNGGTHQESGRPESMLTSPVKAGPCPLF